MKVLLSFCLGAVLLVIALSTVACQKRDSGSGSEGACEWVANCCAAIARASEGDKHQGCDLYLKMGKWPRAEKACAGARGRISEMPGLPPECR